MQVLYGNVGALDKSSSLSQYSRMFMQLFNEIDRLMRAIAERWGPYINQHPEAAQVEPEKTKKKFSLFKRSNKVENIATDDDDTDTENLKQPLISSGTQNKSGKVKPQKKRRCLAKKDKDAEFFRGNPNGQVEENYFSDGSAESEN